MGQSHLTEAHRSVIAQLRQAGMKLDAIGQLIGYTKGTISRELVRNADPQGPAPVVKAPSAVLPPGAAAPAPGPTWAKRCGSKCTPCCCTPRPAPSKWPQRCP
jgi:hypothetical protein